MEPAGSAYSRCI